jgi:hypothetical protein
MEDSDSVLDSFQHTHSVFKLLSPLIFYVMFDHLFYLKY